MENLNEREFETWDSYILAIQVLLFLCPTFCAYTYSSINLLPRLSIDLRSAPPFQSISTFGSHNSVIPLFVLNPLAAAESGKYLLVRYLFSKYIKYAHAYFMYVLT
jgi:hypothetical protein